MPTRRRATPSGRRRKPAHKPTRRDCWAGSNDSGCSDERTHVNIDPNAYRVREGDEVDLDKWPTCGEPLCKSKKAYRKLLQEQVDQLSDYQELL